MLDKFVASQLFNHGDGTAKEACYPNPAQAFQAENKQPEEALDYASTFVHRWICHMLFFICWIFFCLLSLTEGPYCTV